MRERRDVVVVEVEEEEERVSRPLLPRQLCSHVSCSFCQQQQTTHPPLATDLRYARSSYLSLSPWVHVPPFLAYFSVSVTLDCPFISMFFFGGCL